jgi:hypothetical protein
LGFSLDIIQRKKQHKCNLLMLYATSNLWK